MSRPRVAELFNGEDLETSNVKFSTAPGSMIQLVNDLEYSGKKLLLVDGDDIELKLKKRSNNDLTLRIDIKPVGNFSMTAVLQSDNPNSLEFTVTYRTVNYNIMTSSESIFGIGEDEQWRSLTRDLGNDLQKAYAMSNRRLPLKAKSLKLLKLMFNGKAYLRNIKLTTREHEAHFRAAVKWMMQNQDEQGGWPIKVNRRLSNGALVLNAGWYSAMAQGQAISLLCRYCNHFMLDILTLFEP